MVIDTFKTYDSVLCFGELKYEKNKNLGNVVTEENCVSGVTPSSRVEEMTLIWYLETAKNSSILVWFELRFCQFDIFVYIKE